ncbi:MAG TPA: Hsp20/alpha crystallin family protein [Candidatus Limnocylindrales bacterium]|jgi:HSP20 family protein|nr:Hsp20/alpha crystallin family protein [Candidatus Limnocylindrales bacterium]
MSMIRRTSPFGELLSLRQAMDRLFEDSFVRPRSWALTEGQLPLDVHNTKDELVIRAALPGFRPDDVEITITGDTLTISAQSEQEQRSDEEGWMYREIHSGSVTRTVALPSDLDTEKASARFENGMLRLTIPKAEQAKPRQVKISATDDASKARQVEAEPVSSGSGTNA